MALASLRTTTDIGGSEILNPDKFWESYEAKDYEQFATKILSDRPAYEVVYEMLEPTQEKFILDYGCHHGESTRLISRRGAKFVFGVDMSRSAIKHAALKLSGYPDIAFDVVLPGESILNNAVAFDAVSMTFVHPTIQSQPMLNNTIGKIARVTKPGGQIVMLGLNPMSLVNEHSFNFYEHKLPDGEHYRDGKPFHNKLILPDGLSIEFDDYCWSETTLEKLLSINGFSQNIRFINLSRNLPGRLGEVLNRSIEQIEQEYPGIQWKDEWSAPLYQIITATRDNEEA